MVPRGRYNGGRRGGFNGDGHRYAAEHGDVDVGPALDRPILVIFAIEPHPDARRCIGRGETMTASPDRSSL